jgi:hypothetical protein
MNNRKMRHKMAMKMCRAMGKPARLANRSKWTQCKVMSARNPETGKESVCCLTMERLDFMVLPGFWPTTPIQSHEPPIQISNR